MQRAHRHHKGSDEVVFLALVEVVEGRIRKPHIAVVGDDGAECVAVVVNDYVVIPLLYAELVGLYVKRAVFIDKAACPARLVDAAVGPEQLLFGFALMIHAYSPFSLISR